MEVILLERIERLGKLGDVVRVKDGYARNYLLPQRKALRATKEAHAHFETERVKIEQANDARRGDASAVAQQMAGLGVVMVEQAGENGQLYGSVSARDIAASLSAAGYPVDRRQVVVNAVIKSLGLHKVQVRLHAEVPVEVTVNVARSEEEAKVQAAGVNVTSVADDEVESTPDIEKIFEQLPESELLAGESSTAPDGAAIPVGETSETKPAASPSDSVEDS